MRKLRGLFDEPPTMSKEQAAALSDAAARGAPVSPIDAEAAATAACPTCTPPADETMTYAKSAVPPGATSPAGAPAAPAATPPAEIPSGTRTGVAPGDAPDGTAVPKIVDAEAVLVPAAAPVGPGAALAARFMKLKKGRIEMSGPSANTRASGIGVGCNRRLVYERTTPAEKRVPHDPGLQAIFDLGNELEKFICREIEDMGIEIVQRGRDYVDVDLEISGHIDALIRFPGSRETYPLEIKGLNPYDAGKIATIEDIRDHKAERVRKYYAQLQTYLRFADKPMGLFAIFNKTSGWIAFIECPRDDFFIETLLARAAVVRDFTKRAELPDRTVTKECEKCPFVAICGPDIAFGAGVEMVNDDELEAMLARRAELAEAHREYESLNDVIKESVPKAESAMVGKFLIRRTFVEAKGYTVKPKSYWKTVEIVDLNKQGD